MRPVTVATFHHTDQKGKKRVNMEGDLRGTQPVLLSRPLAEKQGHSAAARGTRHTGGGSDREQSGLLFFSGRGRTDPREAQRKKEVFFLQLQ